MPMIELEKKFERGPLIPKGEHVLKLVSVEKRRITSTFSKEEDGKADKFIWEFHAAQKDDNGKPFTYTVFTGVRYGNNKAGLTDLLNQMIPDITEETAAELDTEDLVGTKYNTQIRHNKSDKGELFPAHIYLTPFKAGAKAKPKPVVEDEDEVDLFETE